MKIISVVNQKGGTGKTTTLLNLASALSNLEKKILIIDFDPQANISSGLGVRNNHKSVYDLLMGDASFFETLTKPKENLFLIPSAESLAGANIELVNQENRESRLSQILEHLPEEYDYVFIDTPPSLGLLTINSLVAARQALIPVQAEYYALEGLSQLLSTISLVRENINPELEIMGSIITMYDDKLRLSQDILEELYKNFPFRVFRTVIPRNVKLAEAPSFGKSIFEYAPKSSGAVAYKRLAREFLHINQSKI
ncbi:MAG: ParA family protein [Bacteroidetes bacterium]|nr:ParA family protein [Bacteroidota bacterium]